MSAHRSTSQASAPQWTIFTPLPKGILWSGASLLALGFVVNHSPDPIPLLGWVGVAGAMVWGIRRLWKTRSPQTASQMPRSLTPAMVHQALAETQTRLDLLLAEALPGMLPSPYNTQLKDIEQSLCRHTLDLEIVGARDVGKTALRQCLATQSSAFKKQWAITPLDDPSIDPLALVVASESPANWSAPVAQADVVLFMVQGDLTQSEWLALQRLQHQRKRVLLLLNKQDQLLPSQRELVMAQLKQRIQGTIEAIDVLVIAAKPQPIKVRRHQPDSTYQDAWETPEPQLYPLLNRLQTLATQEVSQLVLQRAYQQTLDVQQAIQTDLNRIRRDRALPLLERYQWIAAGTAFANPFPSLDMLATAVITGKLVQELAAIYRIALSLDRAAEIAEVFVATLIRMGLVEASSQILSTTLKGNAVTFAAGGILQGMGAAYLTRIAGLSFIEFFELTATEAVWPLENRLIGPIVQRIFQQHQRVDLLKDFMAKTLQHLRLDDSRDSIAAA